jgi:hypothetical protein
MCVLKSFVVLWEREFGETRNESLERQLALINSVCVCGGVGGGGGGGIGFNERLALTLLSEKMKRGVNTGGSVSEGRGGCSGRRGQREEGVI